LLPMLAQNIQSTQDPAVIKAVFECVKKICKKYRYMFRSDELFTEMNYVIENFSPLLLHSLSNCVSHV
jgi:hypothetical protein